MKPLTLLLLAVACNGPRSSFDMTLSGGLSEQVSTTSSASGSVDDAGNLTIDDAVWTLSMTLPGLAPGQNLQAPTTLQRAQPPLSLIGTCIVDLAGHEATNGSPVNATFSCASLTSADGATRVALVGGSLLTHIDDSSNDPSSCVAPLCP